MASSGWIAVPDPEGSGDAYYWHQITGETTWDRPAGMDVVSLEEANEAVAIAAAGGGAGAAAAVGGAGQDPPPIDGYVAGEENVDHPPAIVGAAQQEGEGEDEDVPLERQGACGLPRLQPEAEPAAAAAPGLLRPDAPATSYIDAGGRVALRPLEELTVCVPGLGGEVTLPEAGSVATWYYQDPAMKQHGPYTLPEMQQWFRAGYFPGFTRVKRASDPEWRPLGSVGSIVAGGVNAAESVLAAGGGYEEYTTVAHFNRRSGKIVAGEDLGVAAERTTDMYNHRAKRQLNAFFDYDRWTAERQAGVKKAKPDKSRKKAKRQPEWLRKLGEN